MKVNERIQQFVMRGEVDDDDDDDDDDEDDEDDDDEKVSD